MESFAPDVIVIGAGAAGLAATGMLSRAGVRTLLLEARDRIGGRILTAHPAGLEVAVELGAEFVHGRPPESFELIEESKLQLSKIKGEPFCSNQSAIGRCDFWSRIEKVLDLMTKEARRDQSFDAFVRNLHDPEISEEDKRAACSYVRGFHAAHPQEISVRSLIEGIEAEETIDGHSQFRLPQGYDALIAALANKIDSENSTFELASPVTRIKWREGSVKLEISSARRPRQVSAPKCLITLPLGVLMPSRQNGSAVEFDPLLSMKAEAFSKLRVGHVVRVTCVFRRRFWQSMAAEGHTLEKMTFLFSNDANFPTWWTLYPLEAPVLTAWAPADCAEWLSQLSDADICERSIQSLARLLHVPVELCRSELVQAFTHNWQADPYSRGAYSYVAVGGFDTQRELAAPLRDTLFFAGEATDFSGHHGTVHGAIASGYRAAKEILQAA